MHIKRPFIPGFLNRLDTYLLKNKPLIWSTRAHLILYYCLLFTGVLTLISYIFPDDPRNRPILTDWTGFLIVISLVVIVLWLIYLLRFNVFKRFGKISAGGTLFNFISYFIIIALIVFFALVPTLVQSHRANKAYTNGEIIADVNAINTIITQLDYDLRSHKWPADTTRIIKTRMQGDYYDGETDSYIDTMAVVEAITRVNNEYPVIDTAQLRHRLVSDSSAKINDSLYIFFNPPRYAFLTMYQMDSYDLISNNMLGDNDLYDRVIRNYKQPDRQALQLKMQRLMDKYTRGVNHRYDYSNDYDKKLTYEAKMNKRYDLRTIDDSMQNILSRKLDADSGFFIGIIYVIYYTSLILTLLLFIFRYSTTRTFFLSILTGFIITLLTSLCLAFSDGGKYAFYSSVLAYFILFLVIASSVWRQDKRSIITGICMNLFLFMVVVIPLVITAFGIEIYKDIHRIDKAAIAYISNLEDTLLFGAQVTGLALLLVLIGTYVHALYRKWYALPVE